MNRCDIKSAIIESLFRLDSIDEIAKLEIRKLDENFPLFASNAILDSLDLVSVITDLEETLSDSTGRFISLTDDAALSREVSPFVTIGSLLNYCGELLEDLYHE